MDMKKGLPQMVQFEHSGGLAADMNKSNACDSEGSVSAFLLARPRYLQKGSRTVTLGTGGSPKIIVSSQVAMQPRGTWP